MTPKPAAPRAAGTTSADRVADVIVLLTRARRPLGVTGIARELDLSKAVVHRILRSLASRELARQPAGSSGYVLGPLLTTTTAEASAVRELRSISAGPLSELRDQTGETATLSVLTGHERVYVDQYESPHEVKMVVELDVPLPLHSGASSKAILAFLPDHDVLEALQQLRPLRPDLDVAAYRADLAEVRRRGYATSHNERNTGAASIAAPVFGPDAKVLGSISSSGPMFRYRDEEQEPHALLVLDAARRITVLLTGDQDPE